MSDSTETSPSATEPVPSRWGAFSHAAFVVIWAASIVSNVGTAIFDTGYASDAAVKKQVGARPDRKSVV